MNNFILSYNPFSATPTEGQLLNHVQVNRFISQYYQPFIGTYILKSDQPIGVLTESLKGLFETSPFMVNVLYPNMSGGSLPTDIWHWINYGFIPAPPPPTTNALGGLLGAALKRDGS